jgi:uncharacterized glyoxalase superfamily metalloenzyme YdcJ
MNLPRGYWLRMASQTESAELKKTAREIFQGLAAFSNSSSERPGLHCALNLAPSRRCAFLRARLFAVMGMAPVGYYDLSAAAVPVHSTAFRPIKDEALRRNPFRVFTWLLRLDLIEDIELRREAAALAAPDVLWRRISRH